MLEGIGIKIPDDADDRSVADYAVARGHPYPVADRIFPAHLVDEGLIDDDGACGTVGPIAAEISSCRHLDLHGGYKVLVNDQVLHHPGIGGDLAVGPDIEVDITDIVVPDRVPGGCHTFDQRATEQLVA